MRFLPTDALQSDTCHGETKLCPLPHRPLGHQLGSSSDLWPTVAAPLLTSDTFRRYRRATLTPSSFRPSFLPPERFRSRAYVPAPPPGAISDTNQQRHSHVIGFYVMLSSPGVAAAPDSVYLFSVEVNSRYSAGGGIKASGSAELIKRSDPSTENFLAFFQRPRSHRHPRALACATARRKSEIRSHWQLEVARALG